MEIAIKLLAIDCSLDACSVALLVNNRISERFQIAPHQHSELLLSMIDHLLIENSLTLKNLHAIALTIGPGAFTGLRIAASVTQGLAFAADLPVIFVSTLQTIAQGIWRQQGIKHTMITIDAKMDEWYRGEYRLSADEFMEPIVPDQLIKPDQIQFPDEKFIPHAQDIISLAKRKYQKGETI